MITICRLPLVTAAGSDCVWAWVLPEVIVLPVCRDTWTLAVRWLAMMAYSATSTNSGSQKKRMMMERK